MKILVLALFLVAAAAGTASAQGFTLQHHSTFTADPDLRNPFVPIGWKKRVVVAGQPVEQQPVTSIRAEDFTVSSILVGDPSLAVVNGHELSEGELAEITVGGRKVAIRVRSIRDGEVTLESAGLEVVALLRPR